MSWHKEGYDVNENDYKNKSMSEVKFIDGLIVKEGKPDFVKAKLSFKIEEFAKFVKENQKDGWLNIDILESKNGKLYGKLNQFEPNKMANDLNKSTEDKDDLPF